MCGPPVVLEQEQVLCHQPRPHCLVAHHVVERLGWVLPEPGRVCLSLVGLLKAGSQQENPSVMTDTKANMQSFLSLAGAIDSVRSVPPVLGPPMIAVLPEHTAQLAQPLALLIHVTLWR
jgi:hypothetical protein